jgi:hypothetical protein
MSAEAPKDNLAVRIASDPALMKLFAGLKDPAYHVPDDCEASLKQMGSIKASDKGVLVSKVTTPEDLQTQLRLLSMVQHCLDRIQDMNTDLYIVQSRWKQVHSSAMKIITLAYFNELDFLKDGVRKTVVSVALQPVQQGIDRLQDLIDIGERTHKHLTATNFNIKDGTKIIQEYLSLFKFGSNLRLDPDREV